MTAKGNRFRIGGSDISTIFGLNHYKSAIQLFMEKTGRIKTTFADTLPSKLGVYLEPFCCEEFKAWFMEQYGIAIDIQEEQCYFVSKHNSRHVANTDRKFMLNGSLAGLEIKTTNDRGAPDWIGENIPDEAYLQVQWYYYVSGFSHFFLAVLIGNTIFKAMHVPRNDVVIGKAIDKANEFLKTLDEDIFPAPDGSASAQNAVNLLYPEARNKEPVELDDMYDQYNEYKMLTTEIGNLVKRRDKIKQDFQMKIGDHTKALIRGKTVLWTKVKKEGYVANVKPYHYRLFRVY